jgi:hypothetical protein
VQLYEIMSGYKPVAIQTYPVLGEKITQDTVYWNNYKVSMGDQGGGDLCAYLFMHLCHFLQHMLNVKYAGRTIN